MKKNKPFTFKDYLYFWPAKKAWHFLGSLAGVLILDLLPDFYRKKHLYKIIIILNTINLSDRFMGILKEQSLFKKKKHPLVNTKSI